MFAYCGNNPVKNVDYFGFFETCFLDDPMNVNRAFITPAIFVGGRGYVADVSSSYYARQNVSMHDRYWRNSCYNPNMTWSNGATNQAPASSNTAGLPKNGATMTSSEVLDTAINFLGPGYVDMGNGRFISSDGVRQVRMGDSDLLGTHGGGPHVNFNLLSPRHKNIHVYIADIN